MLLIDICNLLTHKGGHYNIRLYGCAITDMDNAIMNGYINIIDTLFKRHQFSYKTISIVIAAKNGHLNTLRYFHSNIQSYIIPMYLIDAIAAAKNYPAIVDWLTSLLEFSNDGVPTYMLKGFSILRYPDY